MAIPTSQRAPSEIRRVAIDYLGMVLVVAALIVTFSLTARNFLSTQTFRTIANQIPVAIILTVGMTFVLIVKGIDLSVGSVLALSMAVLGVCLVRLGLSMPVAIAACLGVGLVCGALNGLLVVAWRLPAFIVTLAMLEAARGAAYLVTESRTEYIGARIEVVADTTVLGLSLPFLVAVAIVVAGQVVLSSTPFGRRMVAIGINEEAARLSGITPWPIKLAVFTLCGLLVSVAAVFHTARLASANPNEGVGFELEAIAAAVIGGTSLMGGRGSVVRSFFGVLIIAILGTGLNQLGVQDATKRVITGGVIAVAVIADYYRRRLAERGR